MCRILFALLLGITFSAEAADVAGVHFDDKLQIAPGGPDLVLNGAGLRTRLFVKVYAAGLYLPQPGSNALEIINGAGARRVALTMLRDVSAKQFSEAFHEGLVENNSTQDLERHKAQIEQLIALIESAGEIKKSDTVRVDYLPEIGTRVQINGESRGKPIAGADFYRVVLRVWLGEKPVDAGLKAGMLGTN